MYMKGKNCALNFKKYKEIQNKHILTHWHSSYVLCLKNLYYLGDNKKKDLISYKIFVLIVINSF